MKYIIKYSNRYSKTIIKGIPKESLDKWKIYLEKKGEHYKIEEE